MLPFSCFWFGNDCKNMAFGLEMHKKSLVFGLEMNKKYAIFGLEMKKSCIFALECHGLIQKIHDSRWIA